MMICSSRLKHVNNSENSAFSLLSGMVSVPVSWLEMVEGCCVLVLVVLGLLELEATLAYDLVESTASVDHGRCG